MPICPECLSRDMIKFGKYDRQQRWRCMKCGLTTVYPRFRMLKTRNKKMAHIKITKEKIVCKYCGSPRIVKHGSCKNKQWWLCHDCGKAWIDSVLKRIIL